MSKDLKNKTNKLVTQDRFASATITQKAKGTIKTKNKSRGLNMIRFFKSK